MIIEPGADLREPRYRRECFQRFYSFHLKYRTHPGCVYHLLPAFEPDDPDQAAWVAWLNGNTQNPATTWLLWQVAPTIRKWPNAVNFWNEYYPQLEWDTDRRHQKARFGIATRMYAEQVGTHPARPWKEAAQDGWPAVWVYASSLPHMGRLSAWSLIEFVRLLAVRLPDADTLLLGDKEGSRSHRNGLAVVDGEDAAHWPADRCTPDLVEHLTALGTSLLAEAKHRNLGHPDVSYLTLESALCTYKSWHKPNRRYPNVYADMAYLRLKRAESRFGYLFDRLWDARGEALPPQLRLECTTNDPGLCRVKQNCYLETGAVPMMCLDWPEMESDFDRSVAAGTYGRRAA